MKNMNSSNEEYEKYKALSFGLDYCIPNQSSYNTTETDFAMFYKTFCPNFPHIPGNQLAELKPKFHNACHKYNNIKVSYKF